MKPINNNDARRFRAIAGFALAALTAATAAPARAANSLSFNDPYSYFVQNGIAALQGDFNGDGKPDIAVVSRDGYVQMLLGNSSGTFRQVAITTPVPGPTAAAIGDFNGDGKLDVAIASEGPNSITVLLGNGKGGFYKTVTTPINFQPASLAVGDVNGDGILDAVVGGNTVGSVPFVVFFGKGTGKFGSPKVDNTAPNGAVQPVLLDVNHDGKLDLAFESGGGYTGVQLGNGDGTFPYPVYFQVTGGYEYALGDFNNDGIPDLAVGVNFDLNYNITIALGNGDGTFTNTGTPVPLTGAPGAIVAADVNGDGNQDLLVGIGGLTVFRGNGMGGFGSPKASNIGGGIILTGDYNGDHHLDVALQGSDVVWVSMGDGQGDFIAPGSAPSPIYPASLALGDVTGDGIVDMAILSTAQNNMNRGQLAILQGNGDGTFTALGNTAFGVIPQNVTIADLNGDGIGDLLIGEGSVGFGVGVYVLLSEGAGKFQPVVEYTTPSAPLAIITGDLNHDGIPDLIVLDGTTVSTLLGAGNGTFGTAQSFPAGAGPRTMVTGDFNGDGNLDVAVGDFNGSALLILYGNGDGTFGAPVMVASLAGIGQMVATDFNHDGILDLAVNANGGFFVFLGQGGGTFQLPVTYSVDNGATLVGADFNGDGNIDLATTSFDGEQAYFFLGTGTGAFKSASAFAVPGASITLTNLYTADFNGDGKPDLASLGTPIPIILNTGH